MKKGMLGLIAGCLVLGLVASAAWATPAALFVANYDANTTANFAAGNAADISPSLGTITATGAKYDKGAYYGSYASSEYGTADNISATAGTMMFWYSAASREWSTLYSIGSSDFWAPAFDLFVRGNGWNGIEVYVTDSAGTKYTLGGPSMVSDLFNVNHYALTWDTDAVNGTVDFALYANGGLAGSLNDVAWSGFAFDSTMQVGCYYHPDWGRWVTPNAYGTIDDFGIANYAMSQTQIAAIVNSGAALTAGAMVPEPVTMVLLAMGGVMGWRRRMM